MDEGSQSLFTRHALEPIKSIGTSALRLTLLFSTIAIAMAVFLAPIAERKAQSLAANEIFMPELDQMSTASIRGTTDYTIRRSVLQPTTSTVCIIQQLENNRRVC